MDGVGEERLAAQSDADWSDITAKLAKLGAEIVRKEAEIATLEELVGEI